MSRPTLPSSASPSSSSSSSSPRSHADLKATHHLSSGALSGLTSAVCLQPLDLLKTRLQQGQAKGAKRRKLRAVISQVLKDDGIAGLWRGTIPTVVRNVPGVALYFYSLSSIRASMARSTSFAATPIMSSSSTSSTSQSSSRSALVKLSSQGNLLAGAIARTSVGFMLNPVTVLKTRYESSSYSEYKSLWGAFVSLVRTSGVRGLFQGFTATAVRDAPYAGLYVVFYEKGKEVASKFLKPEWGIPNAALHSGSAITASMLATVVTSPADCVKVAPVENPTIRRAVSHIYSDQGLTGFFSGSGLRISRKAASSAIAWSVYEGLLLFLQKREHAMSL